MSEEEQTAAGSSSYAGFLENFGNEIGSTLDDLASDWNESPYDFADEVKDGRSSSLPIGSAPRVPSLQPRASMDTIEGLSDWSLKKARPLAFANPVYDLLANGRVVAKSRQMNLIPLSQFDINKQHDDSGKHGKHKHQKGLMKKLSSLTMRKHSLKKQEPEMEVTGPLWTDAPAAYEPVQRTESMKKETQEPQELPEIKEEIRKEENTNSNRPNFIRIESSDSLKAAPIKTPRMSMGNFTPVTPEPEDPPKTIPDEVFQHQDQNIEEQSKKGLELPNDKKLGSSGSSTSLASIGSEDAVEEGRTVKTMMEVMHEIEESPSEEREIVLQPQEDAEQEEANENDEEPRLKRNKTLKWSGSRAAPALIREFTRKSKKMKQIENVQSDSPEVSAGESPVRTTEQEPASTTETDEAVKKASKSSNEIGRSPAAVKKRDSSAFTVLSSLLPPAPKLRRSESTKIRAYIYKIGNNSQNALGYATTEFVKQTLQSTEYRPVVLLHSIRSFLTDIRKYLVSNPHVGFLPKIHKLNKHMPMPDVEGAIDDALERLVLYPLRDFIYKRLVIDYARTGKIQLVEDAIKVGHTKSPQELGVRVTLIPPNNEAMEMVKHHFMELQTTYSPYYKLKHLLSAVTTIYENTIDTTCEDQSARKIGADDFLPLLVHSIVQCDFAAADIEAQYIDGLLDPGLLLGEGGYYLTTLISAVQVLSSMKKREAPLPNITDLQGFLKVGISPKSDKVLEVESKDSYLMHKTLHVPPSMTAHNLGMMIAKKYGIKNTKNFCLHVVVNGVAYPLKPQEFPQLVKMDLLTQFSPGSFYFVYRQIEKSPERPKERPGTVDSEHLKINTETGEERILSADKDATQDRNTGSSSEVTSEDSDGSLNRKHKLKVLSLDENRTPDSPIRVGLSSPGFADIPLPENFSQFPDSQSIPTSKAEATEYTLGLSAQVAMAPAEATVNIEATSTDIQDIPPPVGLLAATEDVTVNIGDSAQEVMAPGEATTTDTKDIPPPVGLLEATEDVTADTGGLPPPDNLPEPMTPEIEASPAIDIGSIPPPGDYPHPTAQEDVSLPTMDIESIPLPEPADLGPVTPSSVEIESPLPLGDSPETMHNSSSDLSGSFSGEEDEDVDQSYLRATVVDDVVSPVKKRTPLRTKKALSILEEEKNDELEVSASNVAPPELVNEPAKIAMESTVQEEAESQSKTSAEATTSSPVKVVVSQETTESDLEVTPKRQTPQTSPKVTLTDTSSEDLDQRPGSVLSDNSSTGYRSDGNYADIDGRRSGKGYHSDGQAADDDQQLDVGAQTSVSTLKSYFEEEIHKVTKQAARDSSPHSPHSRSPKHN